MNCRLSFAVLVLLLSAQCRAEATDPKGEFQLQANSAEFWSLFDRGAKLSTVASGFGFTEGPVWDPAGFVYVSDEVTNKIFRVYLDGEKEELIALGDPDGNTFDRQQRLIDCASVLRAIIRIDREGKYQILADRFENKRFNSPNDVVIGPGGAIYDSVSGSLSSGCLRKRDAVDEGIVATERFGVFSGWQALVRGRQRAPKHSSFRFHRRTSLEKPANFRGRAGRKRRGRPGRNEIGPSWESLCYGSERNLGVEPARPPSGYDHSSGTTRKSGLGRCRLRNPLHHCYDFRLSAANESTRFHSLFIEVNP